LGLQGSATSEGGSIPETTIIKALKEADAHFDELSSSQRAILWVTLLEAGKQVEACKSVEVVAEFLSLCRHLGNADFAEFFQEKTERVASQKPACYLNAWSSLDAQLRDCNREALSHPIYLDQADINRALAPIDANRPGPHFFGEPSSRNEGN
jgi:hypothetical protein